MCDSFSRHELLDFQLSDPHFEIRPIHTHFNFHAHPGDPTHGRHPSRTTILAVFFHTEERLDEGLWAA